MSDFVIPFGTYDDVVLAVGVVTHRKVVGSRSVGDASSPVWLHAGKYVRQIGQMADYRHDISSAAATENAAIVEGFFRDDRWEYAVTTGNAEDRKKVLEIVRERVRSAEQRDERERASETEAARRAHAESIRAIRSEREVAMEVAEAWAPGRIAVWQGQDGQWFAGRWDEPFIPGSGTPSETRRVVFTDSRRFENERHSYTAVLA